MSYLSDLTNLFKIPITLLVLSNVLHTQTVQTIKNTSENNYNYRSRIRMRVACKK